MRHPLSIFLLSCGAALLALGLASWAAGIDLVLHPLLRLAPDGVAAHRVIPLSTLGEPRVLVPVALAAIILSALRRHWSDALWLLVAVGGGRLLVELVKTLAHRPRPPLADRLESVGGWSFPSAHSANTMVTALAIAVVAGGGPRAVGAALAVAAVIGWTRLALAVHWPGDVLGGWGIGMAWVSAAILVRRSH